MADGQLILVAGALLAAGIAASLAAGRLRVPGLVLFLGIGMAIGTGGTGWLPLDDYELARRIGVVALALILFEGGLAAGFPEIRPVLASVVSLATIGTVATAAIAGLAATWLFGFSTLEGMLVGSIVAATDGAAIFALLRYSTLRRKLARTLEGESGFNDPVAVLLVVGLIDWIQRPGYGPLDMAGLLASQLAIGLAAGLAIGWLALQGFRRARLATAGLYPVASVATAALAYGLADSLGGSGFLAVYLAGLVLGGGHIPARQTITVFHHGVAWVAQIALFLTLGLLVLPAQLGDVALEGALLALILVAVARPVAAALATAFGGYSARERLVLGWAGLRGAVPVVLATFPVIAGIPHSIEFFNIAFFAVLLSTLLQGATFEPLARRLGVTTTEPALPRPLAESGTIRRLGAEVLEYPIAPGDAIAGARVRDLGLPRDALVNVIVRDDQALPPRGSTRLEAGDRLHVLVREEVAGELLDLVERWHRGPIGTPPRPPRAFPGHRIVFTVRPWDPEDGDPAYPPTVLGVPVVEHMRSRRDARGALLALADGRYAVGGPVAIVGSASQVQSHARKYLARAAEEGERAWWEEVIGVLAR